MSLGRPILKLLDNAETLVCEALLAVFVLLLFAQILARQLFGYSIAWSEELSTYLFVWFAYLGAVVAAKKSAHNRVTFHFAFLPRAVGRVMLALADLLWVAFNAYFVWLSYDFVFNRMNLFWKSQTLGVPMKVFYMILPLAFTLMSLRILWNLYLSVFRGVDLLDPEAEELRKLQQGAAAPR
jgi:C4-dicarboxylate transporter DctQ subunit